MAELTNAKGGEKRGEEFSVNFIHGWQFEALSRNFPTGNLKTKLLSIIFMELK